MNFPIDYQSWRKLLTEDEQDFVQAMVVMKSPNAAAEMCGLDPKRARSLLKSAKVKTGIDLAKRELRNETNFSPADVAEDLMVIRDMALGRIPIAKTIIDKETGTANTVYVRETNLPSASKAVENLGRMLGVFTDKKEIVVPASDNQILKKIEDILGVTVDGTSEDVTDAEITPVIEEKFLEQEDNHLKSLSIDAMVEDLLQDPVLKDAVVERVTPSQRTKR